MQITSTSFPALLTNHITNHLHSTSPPVPPTTSKGLPPNHPSLHHVPPHSSAATLLDLPDPERGNFMVLQNVMSVYQSIPRTTPENLNLHAHSYFRNSLLYNNQGFLNLPLLGGWWPHFNFEVTVSLLIVKHSTGWTTHLQHRNSQSQQRNFLYHADVVSVSATRTQTQISQNKQHTSALCTPYYSP